MFWKILSIAALWITFPIKAQTLMAPEELSRSKPVESKAPIPPKNKKHKSSPKKPIHLLYPLKTKVFFAALATFITGALILHYYNITPNREVDENSEKPDWTSYPPNLSDTIPPFQPTAKDQYTYKINTSDGTFLKQCDDAQKHRGMQKIERGKKESNEEFQRRKLASSIESDYDIFDVTGDGNCCTYACAASIVYQVGYTEKTHNHFVKKLTVLRKKAIGSYKELMASTSLRAQRLLQAEKTIRLKEAHIKFLYSTDRWLALLNEIQEKKIKNFKKKLELMNRLPRHIFSDFIRAGIIIARFQADPEGFMQDKQYFRYANSNKHLLNSCWLDPTDQPIVYLLRALEIGYPAFQKQPYKGNPFITVSWPSSALDEKGIGDLTYMTYDEARIKHAMKVIIVSKNANHYQIAVHPDLMEEGTHMA